MKFFEERHLFGGLDSLWKSPLRYAHDFVGHFRRPGGERGRDPSAPTAAAGTVPVDDHHRPAERLGDLRYVAI
jgi:hypothetical protein